MLVSSSTTTDASCNTYDDYCYSHTETASGTVFTCIYAGGGGGGGLEGGVPLLYTTTPISKTLTSIVLVSLSLLVL